VVFAIPVWVAFVPAIPVAVATPAVATATFLAAMLAAARPAAAMPVVATTFAAPTTAVTLQGGALRVCQGLRASSLLVARKVSPTMA